MAVKRRVIWMGDEDWAGLTGYAEAQGDTVSGLVRRMFHQTRGILSGSPAAPFGNAVADRFNSRPFTPAPKKGK